IELTHTFKGFLSTTLNYSQTNDIIQQVLIQDNSNNTTFIKQDNIASQRQVGLSVNAYNQYTKWWSGNIYVNAFYNKFNGLINNAPVT
ncbi:outer membrane beta-barrel protein, partial [Streptomyces turgidiscabies]|uniref:outer membrane beta-barrel protein n=1 Tax=Streptomyces turgidiscabies TaxID=85558 RepID=UPI0038F72A9E